MNERCTIPVTRLRESGRTIAVDREGPFGLTFGSVYSRVSRRIDDRETLCASGARGDSSVYRNGICDVEVVP